MEPAAVTANDNEAKSEVDLDAARALVDAIAGLKDQAAASARAAEESRRKADSESGFAFNAKNNAEEHAKAISQTRGNVDADFTWLTTTKKNAEEAAQAITATRAVAEADTRAATEAKTTAEKEASAVRTAKEKADAALSAIEKAHTDSAGFSKDANEDAAAVAAAKATADASANVIHSLREQLTQGVAKATSDIGAIAKHEEESEALLTSISDAVAGAKTTHQRVTEYEQDLARFKTAFTDLNAKIESLLPNATSAGLASAFRNQKDRFKNPQRNWLVTFVIAIAALLGAGIIGFPGLWPSAANAAPESWDSILRHMVSRLPIVAPLVWLAIYAGRNHTLTLRLQEEYANKEALSTSFEGYKREMAGISDPNGTSPPPLLALCEMVLRTLAQRPGRIYEGRHDDITPLAPVAKAIGGAAVEVVKATKKNT